MTAHFEAKKHAYRQTQDGIVVSFVVHPNDMTPELATAALGTRYMVAFSEIGDDGKPKEQSERLGIWNDPGPKPKKPSKPFHTLPLSQQAALRCGEPEFWRYLKSIGQVFISRNSAPECAEIVRHVCNVKSRSEFDADEAAAQRWNLMESGYQAWLTTQKYSESMR